jgi:hypothetical protein
MGMHMGVFMVVGVCMFMTMRFSFMFMSVFMGIGMFMGVNMFVFVVFRHEIFPQIQDGLLSHIFMAHIFTETQLKKAIKTHISFLLKFEPSWLNK